MNNSIDIEKYKKWPLFDAWLNEVITHFESNVLKVQTKINTDGTVEYTIPSESAISTRIYAMANTAEFSADAADQAVNTAKMGHSRTKNRISESIKDVAIDIETSQVPPIVEVITTGRSQQISARDILSEIVDPSSATIDALKRNKTIEWFSDCLPCDGRATATLSTDLSLPEIIIEIADFVGEIEDVLDLALESFDSSKFLANICSIMPIGRWCIQDLTALLGVLATQLRQYWLIDPSLKFSWWGLVATLIYPIMQALYMIVSMTTDVALGPVDCLLNLLDESRALIKGIENLDQGMGLSLGHLQEALLTSAPLVSLPEDVKERIQGKVDWFAGDTLIDYADILSILNPIELALLSVTDFSFRLSSMADWLSSRLSVLRSKSHETIFAALKITNVMFAIGRLYSFVKVLIQLSLDGKSICTADDEGRLIPADDIENIFNNTAVIPPWVQVLTSHDPSNTQKDLFTIIDTSLGTEYRALGCLGRLSAAEEEKVRKWMEELDNLEVN